jgi:chemotaxis protein MotB
MEDKKQPIIVKKIIAGGHGHHGGAWKVAFADFVTAMMAFFMVMWLVGAATTEQKAAISSYFKNPSLTEGRSQKAAQGQMGPGGSSTSMIKLGGTMEITRARGKKILEQSDSRKEEKRSGRAVKIVKESNGERMAEKKRLDTLLAKLKEAIGKSQALKPFKDQLLLDITPQGLRIQIIDKENRAMFNSGSAKLKYYTVRILHEIVKTISKVPNKISISGHTDATPYTSREDDYTNWELSADRANAARRALIEGGMKPGRIGRVVGLADSVLFDKKHPTSPINRRISIIVMNRATEKEISEREGYKKKEPVKKPAPKPLTGHKPGNKPAATRKPAKQKPVAASKKADKPAVKPAVNDSNDDRLFTLPGQDEPVTIRVKPGDKRAIKLPVIKKPRLIK